MPSDEAWRRHLRLSLRNQLPGTVHHVISGDVMAVVKVELHDGNGTVTSTITREAAEDLGLTPGRRVVVLVKATDVSLARVDLDLD